MPASPNTPKWIKKMIRARQFKSDGSYTHLRREILAEINEFNKANPEAGRYDVIAHITKNTEAL